LAVDAAAGRALAVSVAVDADLSVATLAVHQAALRLAAVAAVGIEPAVVVDARRSGAASENQTKRSA
jgi:hypothetical protein